MFAPLGILVLWMLSALSLAADEFSLPQIPSTSSVSGQFLVTEAPGSSLLGALPEVARNPDLARLEPPLLAVSADRFRASFLHKLGVNPSSQWSGKIYLVLHPAQSLDENVAIISGRMGDGWDYHVLIPDIVPRDRLARALTGVLLLEYANRNASDRSAEIPPWLVDGLAQELLNENLQDLIISTPGQTLNGLPYAWMDQTEHSVDPLAGARQVLQDGAILTFSQLSWPSETQLSNEDGGAYRASAQLFTHELLALPNGGAKLRAMVALLPRYYNWQTAFWAGFKDNFSDSLEVEKWWALQSVIFASQSPGPQWTRHASREKLDDILSVAVEYRGASNNLPAYATVSLQQVVQNFNPAQQTEILQMKLRDLEMAQLRMDPSLAVLTAEYRNALAGYLGVALVKGNGQTTGKQIVKVVSAGDTIQTLDVLDAQRRSVALADRPGLFVPQ